MKSRRRPVIPPAVVAVVLLPVPLVQAAWQADPTLRQGPSAIVGDEDRVLAASADAAAFGVQPG